MTTYKIIGMTAFNPAALVAHIKPRPLDPAAHLAQLREKHSLSLTNISERIRALCGTDKYQRRIVVMWLGGDTPCPGWVPAILGLSLLYEGRINLVQLLEIVKRGQGHQW